MYIYPQKNEVRKLMELNNVWIFISERSERSFASQSCIRRLDDIQTALRPLKKSEKN